MTRRTPVARVRLDQPGAVRVTRRPDAVAVEEPLEIRVDGAPLVTTMRTPGDDLDLALGFLLAEGLLPGPDAVATGVHCSDVDESGSPTFNVLELTLAAGVPVPDVAGRRSFGVTSACGVCGSASIDAVRERGAAHLSGDLVRVDAEVLVTLPGLLRDVQGGFERTGGLHAAALFDAAGGLLAAAEDVGRHNAVDKVLGRCARERGWPLPGTVLVLSGRASFELVQKAWVAGVPVVAAVSAPSSLAVEVAEASGQTLVGFLRPPTFNVYAGGHRVLPPGTGPRGT